MYILKASTPDKNRVRFNFANAIHKIENMNINESNVSANIRSYASLESYNYVVNANTQIQTQMPMDGRQIADVQKSTTFSVLGVDSTNTLDEIKEAFYNHLMATDETFSGGTIVNE